MRQNQNGLIHLIIVVVGACAIGSILVSALANNAKPGDSFYTIDRGLEKIKLFTAWSDDDKARAYADLAKERQDELITLVDESAPQELIDQAASDFLTAEQKVIDAVASLPEEAKKLLINEIAESMSAQNQELETMIGQLDLDDRLKLQTVVAESKQNFNQLTENLSSSDLRQIEEAAKTQVRNISDLLKRAGL